MNTEEAMKIAVEAYPCVSHPTEAVTCKVLAGEIQRLRSQVEIADELALRLMRHVNMPAVRAKENEMTIKKVVTGELDGTPAMWLEGTKGEIKRIARFDDPESYEDFLNCLEAGFFNATKFNRGIHSHVGTVKQGVAFPAKEE